MRLTVFYLFTITSLLLFGATGNANGPASVSVALTDTGFSPSTVDVSVDTTINLTNSGNEGATIIGPRNACCQEAV